MEKRNVNKFNVLFRCAHTPAKWMKNPRDANLIIICQKKIHFSHCMRRNRIAVHSCDDLLLVCSQRNNKSKKLLTNRFIYVFVSLFTLAVMQFALLSSICIAWRVARVFSSRQYLYIVIIRWDQSVSGFRHSNAERMEKKTQWNSVDK